VGVPSGLRTESRIFLQVTLNSLLDVPKISFFSLSLAFEATKHTPTLYSCSRWRYWISARRLALCAASHKKLPAS